MNNTIEQILFESERRRKMFHWLIDGLGSFHLKKFVKLLNGIIQLKNKL